MGIHDWTKVDHGIYHAFHFNWIHSIEEALNDGCLPSNYYALPEQYGAGSIADLLTLKLTSISQASSGGVAVAEPKPKTKLVQKAVSNVYASRANRLVIRNLDGEAVAVIEIISPGNKSSQDRFEEFLEKAWKFIRNQISFFVIDPFPPTRRDPQGIHAAIWEGLGEVCEHLPTDKSLTVASYETGDNLTAYVEPLLVGDPLPEMPLFLGSDRYVKVPLQATYERAWKSMSRVLKPLLGG